MPCSRAALPYAHIVAGEDRGENRMKDYVLQASLRETLS